jgi:hypothetical protein
MKSGPCLLKNVPKEGVFVNSSIDRDREEGEMYWSSSRRSSEGEQARTARSLHTCSTAAPQHSSLIADPCFNVKRAGSNWLSVLNKNHTVQLLGG